MNFEVIGEAASKPKGRAAKAYGVGTIARVIARTHTGRFQGSDRERVTKAVFTMLSKPGVNSVQLRLVE